MSDASEIGRRIREARENAGLGLRELSEKTDGVLGISRIGNYEAGIRTPGVYEVKVLAAALGVRAAYLMTLEDGAMSLSREEEALVRNWRALPEKDRMDYFRRIEHLSMLYRDPVPDERLAKAFKSPTRKPVKRK